MSNHDPVYLNDLGIVCSLGTNSNDIYQKLTSSAETSLTSNNQYSNGKPLMLGVVNGSLPSLKPYPAAQQTRTNQLLRAAYEQIESSFQKAKESVPVERIAIVIGTSTSGIEETEKAVKQVQRQQAIADTYSYQQQNLGNPADALAQWAGIAGPSYCISTACTSGAKALASGRRLLRSGMFDIVLAGGVDSLCSLTVNGFASLEAVSADNCLPFSANRKGINIGEGAALFMMSREASDICLTGVGESSDAHHISAPEPDGKGASKAIESALKDAQLERKDIDYLNLHGTATDQNDRMEARAVHRAFGDNLACSSTKGYTGHTLGAAGAIEAAFCYLALIYNDGQLPLHLYDGAYDNDLPVLDLVKLDRPRNPISKAMSNSFAFGGNNISLILERK
jgi:3-oxoacyl-[acyl-carrier-protein] synthase I